MTIFIQSPVFLCSGYAVALDVRSRGSLPDWPLVPEYKGCANSPTRGFRIEKLRKNQQMQEKPGEPSVSLD
jgi:hypothetical protein